LLGIFVCSQILHERRCLRLRTELVSALHEDMSSSRKD
jgi:hypothetical protein